MTTSFADVFKTYGITGNAAVDAIILAHIIPFIISYAQMIIGFLQNFVSKFILEKINDGYSRFKKKFLGTVDFRLCVSQDMSIYPTIKSIFFSPLVKSDEIDIKTLGVLNLITESKFDREYVHTHSFDVHDLHMDSNNNITIEKRMDFGSSISKKYFEFENYYIVVSENKKTDFMYFRDYTHAKKPDDANNDKKECFILFEAIRRSDKTIQDDNIVKKFLYDRFKINVRIPYKYVINLKNEILYNRFSNCDTFLNNDGTVAQLVSSDDTNKFFSNPHVKNFYGSDTNTIRSTNKIGLSSNIVADYRSNSFNLENMSQEILLNDIYMDTTSENIFEPNFKSILTYFFGARFNYASIANYRHFFTFRNNKIILYFYNKNENNIKGNYLCIISFQEIITREKLIDIFTDIINTTVKVKTEVPDVNKQIRVFNYKQNEWLSTKCDARTYDTIFLPTSIKQMVTTEMDKFICFEKVFKTNGIPYKKGFLFYGPPGTGKTSLVRALANMYDIPIYIFDINNGSVNDGNISQIMNSISGVGNRILLFEDIDSAFSNKEELKYQLKNNTNTESQPIDSTKSKQSKNTETETITTLENNTDKKFLSYSALINSLDGVMTGLNGTIVIMTTNYPERLGQSLIRPGRIDYIIELTFCDRHQIIEMTKNIITKSYEIIKTEMVEAIKKSKSQFKISFLNPYDDEQLAIEIEKFAGRLVNGQALSTVKPCELQVYILKHIENVSNIFENYKELIIK